MQQLTARLAVATFASLGLLACSDSTTPPDTTPDAMAMQFDAAVGMCPPAGATGVQVGDLIPSPSLVDCDGRPFDLHSLCGKVAAHQFHFAGW